MLNSRIGWLVVVRRWASWRHILRGSRFLSAKSYTLADIALYAYTHVAHEAGFDLAPYKNVLGWMERVASQPGYVSIYQRPAN